MKKSKRKVNIDIKYLFNKLGLRKPRNVRASNIGSNVKTRSSRHKRRPRFSLGVKNKRKLFMFAGASVLVIGALIVIIAVTGGDTSQASKIDAQAANIKDEVLSSEDSAKKVALTSSEDKPIPTTTPLGQVSVAMPVYTSLSIKKGIKASVVTEVQIRLMELDFADADEPDAIYGSLTKESVERFQKQHGLEVSGEVDQQTYDLMMSNEAGNYVIAIGEKNTNVQELQQRLYELGYISSVTGYFGTDTEAAVMKFQKINNLTEDGKVGKNTREMIYSNDAKPNLFSYGEESPEIKEYQTRLKKLGYLTTDPDGNFGDDTKAAVKLFQENNGLIADGYIGPSTKTALMSDNAQNNALAIGNKGETVESVQKRLKKLGYISKATGYFGSDTDSAVRSFQKRNNLSVDGKVGPRTMNVLMSSSAKKASTGGGGGGGGGSNDGGSNDGGGGGSDPSISGPNIDSFISVARSKKGAKYVRGGKGPKVFDCSGFVYWCLNQVGVKQGYMTSHTWAKCTKYKRIEKMSDMKRGDVIVFKGHVAIYAGNGVMIDASSNRGKIVERGCTSSWSKNNFICAYRIF